MIDRVALEAAIARAIGIYMVHGVSVREAASGAADEVMRLVGDRVLVPREPTGEMIAAALCALTEWRNSLSRDEAILRRSAPVQSGRVFLASATPEEKAAIRYRAMISAATEADGGK